MLSLLGGSFAVSPINKLGTKDVLEMNWLERASFYIFAGGIGLTIAGINTLNIDDKVGRLMLLAGMGVSVAGLVIWSSINILLKGSKNAES